MDKKRFEIVRSTKDGEKEKKIKVKVMDETIVQAVVEKYKEKHEFQINKFKTSPNYSKLVLGSIEGWEVVVEIERALDSVYIHFNGRKLEEYQRVITSDVIWEIIEFSRFKHKNMAWILGDYCIDGEEYYQIRLDVEKIKSFSEEWEELFEEMIDQVNDERLNYFMEEQEIDEMYLYITGDDGVILCKMLEELGILTFAKIDVNLYEIKFMDNFDHEETMKLKMVFSNYLRSNGYNCFTDYE